MMISVTSDPPIVYDICESVDEEVEVSEVVCLDLLRENLEVFMLLLRLMNVSLPQGIFQTPGPYDLIHR